MPTTGMYPAYQFEAHRDTYHGIAPLDGSYLAIDAPGVPTGGAAVHGSIVFGGSEFLLPTIAPTDVITASVQYQHRPAAAATAWGMTIYLVARGLPTVELFSVPEGSGTSTWGALASAQIPSSYGHRAVRVELVIYNGWNARTMAIDQLRFFRNGQPLRDVIPLDQEAGACRCETGATTQQHKVDPVNTFSGVFHSSVLDLGLVSAGPELQFARSYMSMFADSTQYPVTALGPGWRHSYAHALTLPTAVGGEANTVIYEAPTGNRFRFYDDGAASTTLVPYPGVRGSLLRSTTGYTLTLRDDSVYAFDLTGRLTTIQDRQGHQLLLSYVTNPALAWDGQLDSVLDPLTQRSLTLGYTVINQQVRLDHVTDSAQRRVSYTYSTDGNLEHVTDLHGGVTTYQYASGSSLLTSITDPVQQLQVSNVYDSQQPTPRVIQQTDAQGLVSTLSYQATATGQATLISRQGPGVQEAWIDHYRHDGSFEWREQAGSIQGYTTYDTTGSPSVLVDGNGHASQLTNTATGLVSTLVDAAQQMTVATYRGGQRLDQVTYPDGRQIMVQYDQHTNAVTQLTRGGTLVLTTTMTYRADNRLETMQGSDGVVTRYTYTPSGQVASMIVGDGTPLAQTTSYGYDALGRQQTVTTGVGTPLQRTDRTEYNADNTVATTIQNYQDGVFTAQYPDQDIVTTYGYDLLGRQIWVKNVLGQYDVTRYNAQGQVEATARSVIPLSLDSAGQPIIPSFSVSLPDRNVATRYGYDGLGRSVLVTETGILTGSFTLSTQTFSQADERVTRMEYDTLSRPVTVTLNYKPSLPVDTLPDVNVRTLTRYDGAGNPIWQRDALGRWTKTEYDALNRPWKTTVNYENGDPLSICGDSSATGQSLTLCDADRNGVRDDNRSWASLTDTDQIQVTQYRADGQVDRTIAHWIDGVYDAQQPDADRITVVGYDAIGRPTSSTRNYVDGTATTGTSDTDQITRRVYESAGRLQASRDGLGRYVWQHYDALGRVDRTVQNCRNTSGTPVSSGCAAFAGGTNPNLPTPLADRNIPQTTGFDALGRVETTTDAYGRVNRTQYDGLGRVLVQTRNYVDGSFSSSAPDTDVSTVTGYDALGRVVSTQDAALAVTQQQSNGLGQTTVITDSLGRVTRMGYDGQGQQRWTMTPDGRVSVTVLDGLGRTLRSIQHYQDGISSSADVDQDLIQRTVYDRAGRVFQQIDAVGQVTQFAYDQADRLLAVTENAATGACPKAPCNVVTWYGYDRAGNRVSHTDANSHMRTWSYDAADRMVRATDALSQTATWHYDAVGRVTSVDDPRGVANTLSYQYSDLDQQTQVQATNLGTLTHTYNALGQRITMTDGTGTTSFRYDALGRMTQSSAPQTGVVGYGYDARGLRTSLRYPDGTQIQYGYRADGSLATVQQGSSTLAQYVYDPVGRLDHVTRANGVVTSYGYDGVDRLTDMQSVLGSQVLSGAHYTLDRQGLRRQLTESQPVIGTPTATSMTPTPTTGPATNTPTATTAAATSTPTAPPSGSTVLAQDSFSRTVSNGWGSADIGGAYNTPNSNLGDYAVSGGMGRLTLPSAGAQREQMLSGTAQDVDMSLRVMVDALPIGTGGEVVTSLIGRRISTGNDYRVQVRILADGSVKVYAQTTTSGSATTIANSSKTITGLTVAAGSVLRARMQIVGTNPPTIQARVWADGSTEPTTWALSVPEPTAAYPTAGIFGLRVVRNSSATGPTTIIASLDDLLVTDLSGSTATSTPTTAPTATNTVVATSTPTTAPTATNTAAATSIPTATSVAPTTTPTPTASGSTPTPTTAPLSGLVAAYSFDAGSGTTLADATGNGHTGTLVNGPSWTATGKYGGALSFDGVNDLVSIADANDLDLSTGMTLAAWVKPTVVGTWQSVIFKTNGSQDLAYALYAYSDSANNNVRGYLNNGGQVELAGGSTLAAATWTHLALSYDGSTMRLYVNGSQVAQQSLSTSIVASTGALELGGNTSYGNEWFAGLLDEVRIYNRALSASEIITDRDTPLGGSGPTATPTSGIATATPTATSLPATSTPTATSLPTTSTPTATSAVATSMPTATSVVTSTPGTGLLVQDSFTRSVTAGWGSADLGGSYATPSSSRSDYAVVNGVGQLTLPAATTNREQGLRGTAAPSAQDVEISLAVAADRVPTGSTELRFGALARQVSADTLYRAVTRLIPGGSLKLQAQKVVNGTETWLGSSVTVSGLTVTDGSVVRVRIQVVGANPTTIRMRAWAGGSSEPTTWQYTTTDSTATALQTAGTFGLRAQLTSGATNAPIVARFDDWTVSTTLSASGAGREQRAQGSGVWGLGSGAANPHQESGMTGSGAPNPQTQDPKPQRLPNPDSPIFTSFGKALLRQLQQSISTTTRTITYDYDGLQRLTSAIENPGTHQSYSYDLAGNRTGVWVNGTRTQNYIYNAANQNQATGWQYDAVGNLLSDGTTRYQYDALNRTTIYTITQPYNQWTAQRLTYNADGVLVQRVQREKGLLFDAERALYTQDLAAPLSQILAETDANDSTTQYFYGAPAERLLSQWETYRTWYSVDALGSVRATLNDAGLPTAVASYDAWGVPETPLIGSFGFTGELQRGNDVWLRARWYGAGRGGFGGRDPWVGEAQTPYSLQYYQYGYSNPVLWTDASGQRVSPGEAGGSCGPGGKDASGHCRPATTPEPILRPVPAPLACGTGAQPPCAATPTPTPHAQPSPHHGALAGAGMVFITKPHPLSVAIGVCIIVLAYAAGQTVTQPPTTSSLPNYVLPDDYVTPETEPLRPAPVPGPEPAPSPTPTNNNRGVIQIQGHDITENTPGATKDTQQTSGEWMLSVTWEQTTPFSVRDGRRELAKLWKNLSPDQIHRRDRAYYQAIAWMEESLHHSPPGRFKSERISAQNPPNRRFGFSTARIDITVWEGVAFNVP